MDIVYSSLSLRSNHDTYCASGSELVYNVACSLQPLYSSTRLTACRTDESMPLFPASQGIRKQVSTKMETVILRPVEGC